MKIVFLIVDDNISGGMNMVKAYAADLAAHGNDVSFVAERVPACRSVAGLPCFSYDDAAKISFDIAVLTFYILAFSLPKLHFKKLAHFVQRLEYQPLSGASAALSKSLLSLPVPCIAVSSDIRSGLISDCGVPADLVSLVLNGIDKAAFYVLPVEKRPNGRLRVLVEGPVDVPFKGVVTAIRAARRGGAAEVWLLTSSPISDFPGCDRVFSRIPAAETPGVYKSCDCLVKMSEVEGMCLPPLEMFHAGGTAVVYSLPPLVDYAEDGENCLLYSVGDADGVAEGVRRLASEPELLSRLEAGACATAACWPELSDSAAQFAACLRALPPAEPEKISRFLEEIRKKHRIAAAWACLKSRMRRR